MSGSPESTDGAAARLRIAGPADAAALLALKGQLDKETQFMLLEPDERDPSAEAQAGHLDRVARSGNSVVIVAGDGDELVGYVDGVHRLELTVMAHNSRAIALYERVGFVTEGRRRECLWLDGRFRDECYMSKLLPGPAGDPGRAARCF